MTVRFKPIGSAPQLRRMVFQVSSSNRFETVVTFLRKKILETGKGADATKQDGSVFCYVNSVFAPSLDEGVGGLWKVRMPLL